MRMQPPKPKCFYVYLIEEVDSELEQITFVEKLFSLNEALSARDAYNSGLGVIPGTYFFVSSTRLNTDQGGQHEGT